MKKVLASLASLFWLLSVGTVAAAAEKSSVTSAQLQQMFSNMRSTAKWNVDGELLWGYFFTDPDQRKLQPVAKELTQAGYHLVNIYPTDDKTTYVLHVEKVEHHTVESLNTRNQEFERLAEKHHLQSYDGMDVGPVSGR